MKQLLLLLFLCTSLSSRAAYIIKDPVVSQQTLVNQAAATHYLEVMDQWEPSPFGRKRYHKTRRHTVRDVEWNDTSNAISSFFAGLGALLCVGLMLLIPGGIPVLAFLTVGASVTAIVAGAKGRKRRLRGLAIAGMIMGMIVLGAAVAGALGLLLVAVVESMFDSLFAF